MTFKYNNDYERIRALEADDKIADAAPLLPFDLEELEAGSWLVRRKSSFLSWAFRAFFPLVRALPALRGPIARLQGVVVVARAADVRDVLRQPGRFEVPFGHEMTDLAGGSNFVLGLEGHGHERQRAILKSIMRREDEAVLRDDAARFAAGLIENADGRIDVMGDFILRVATECCFRYFGFRADSGDFAAWTLGVSNLLFADPTGSATNRKLGRNAAARLRLVIDDAIDRSLRNPDTNNRNGHVRTRLDATLVDRLVNLGNIAGGPSLAEIRAILLGLIVGFVPTIALAAGKILQAMLDRPEAMADARAHAADRNDQALAAVLMELARLNPALQPCQWRYCVEATDVGGGFLVPKGMTVAVGTAAALRDHSIYADPDRYNPRRGPAAIDPNDPNADLVFGLGIHDCAGRHIATTVMTAMFAELLRLPNLVPVAGAEGRVKTTGPFATRLVMQFDTPAAHKTMFFVVIPIAKNMRDVVERLAHGLGHPAGPEIAEALDLTGIVHFASLAVLDDDDDKPSRLILELTVDGTAPEALKTIAAQCGDRLRPIFEATGAQVGGDLAAFLAHPDRLVFLHAKLSGATGLDFQGIPGMSVARIRRTRAIADAARTLMDDHLGRYAGQGTRAMRVLTHVRRAIMQDQYYALANYPVQQEMMAKAKRERFDAWMLIPSRRALPLANFSQPSKLGAFRRFLLSRRGLPFTAPLAFLLVGLCAAFGGFAVAAAFGELRLAVLSEGFWTVSTARAVGGLCVLLAEILVGGVLRTLVALAVLGALAWLILRWHERRDIPDERAADIRSMQAISAAEDHPGYTQNHIFAYGTLKPGVFRVVVHGVALWVIGLICEFYYRPGFVLSMGTIHSAHWWRVPGTRKVAFHANYDGSWDSYLEDFITRVPTGQTGAWSNWIGFPRTRNLIQEGAHDGDRFKRWVRTQQRPAAFWYTAFRHMTTEQIRTNALIHHGLARAKTDDEARDWLRLSGSRPRMANVIESDDVQSLVFDGLKRLPESCCLQIRLPAARADLWRWHGIVLGHANRTGLPDAVESALSGLPGMTIERGRAVLLDDYRITFGDKHAAAVKRNGNGDIPERAVFLAFSARGIECYRDAAAKAEGSSPVWHVPELVDNFPATFRIGMAGRARTLGDASCGEGGLAWRWADGAGDPAVHGKPETVEAVLMLYGADAATLADAVTTHRGVLEAFGGKLLGETPTYHSAYEHFRYRDGISQPAIRGTGRFTRGVPERDVVEPGEFILGYASNQGYLPLSPTVRGESDSDFNLAIADPGVLSGVPDFGASNSANAPRDFGRNGSYLVIRELEQDVTGFNQSLEEQANRLNSLTPPTVGTLGYRRLDQVVGQVIDAEWVAAKLMGRWRDGRPLVGHPLHNSAASRRFEGKPDNDFAYGVDDPMGVACPFAAHIRRANPRDSKLPGDDQEQAITNRHRLLRRGRNYDKVWGTEEKGMVFMALCSNLERQFEFVQQTWMNAPSFHGLEREPDAFVGSVDASYGDRCYSMPTAAGAVRLKGLKSHVRPRAGGYFFLPGRAALLFLERLVR